MLFIRYLLVVVITCASCSTTASIEEVALINKPLFGLAYDIGLAPKVDRFLHTGKTSTLPQLHRGSLEVSYPYFRYLSLGLSIDYTLAISAKDGDPRLDVSKTSKKISSTYLGVSGRIRPQLPITLGNWDLILYTEAQLGLGTSSPIAFGTQPLSDYQYKNTSNIPSPFPLMFETTPKIGIQIFGWRFIGLDVAFGLRTLWVVHPMVSIPAENMQEGISKDQRGAIWYDVTAPFIQAGLKFAF